MVDCRLVWVPPRRPFGDSMDSTDAARRIAKPCWPVVPVAFENSCATPVGLAASAEANLVAFRLSVPSFWKSTPTSASQDTPPETPLTWLPSIDLSCELSANIELSPVNAEAVLLLAL